MQLLDRSTIIERMIRAVRAQTSAITYFGPGPFRAFLYAVAGEVQGVYYKMFKLEQRLDILSAKEADLDRYASSRGLQRLGATQASVLVTVEAPGSEALVVPVGLRVSAGSGTTFVSTEPVTLLPLNTGSSVLRGIVRMRSEGTGETQNIPALSIRNALNVPQLSIVKLSDNSVVTGTTITVSNPAAAQGGSDVEGDATFRSRIMTLFSALNQGTAMFYEAQLRAINPNIVRVFLARGSAPNEVLAYCVTADGSPLTTQEKQVLAGEMSEVVPVLTSVTIKDMLLEPINVSFATTLSGGVTEAEVAQELADAYREFLDWRTWPFYRSVQADDLLRVASGIRGVDSLSLSSFSPSTDVPLGPATLPRLGTIEIQNTSTGQTTAVSGFQQLYPRL
jgi:hypothetical protein